jgi:hypothetical protein
MKKRVSLRDKNFKNMIRNTNKRHAGNMVFSFISFLCAHLIGVKRGLSYFRKAFMLGTLGLTTLVVAPQVSAQTTAQAGTTPVVLTKDTTAKKPYVFKDLTKNFSIDNGSKNLTVAVANMQGDTTNYNSIRVNIYDHLTEKSSKWWVAGIVEPAEDMHRTPWVALGNLSDPEGKPLTIFAEDVVKYVKILLEDARNLSGAEVKRATKTLTAAVK